MQGRHDLTDAEWAIISPLPPDKPRGVPRVDDRRAISGIFHVLRTGTPWRDLPERCGRKKGGPDHAIGRSRGGLSTKIHVVVDDRGLPRRFVITPGQASDKAAVPALLDGLEPARDTVADRGCDSRTILKRIADHGSCPHIPTQRDRREQRSVPDYLYRQRNLVERFFNKLKHFRGIARRHHKLARNFLAAIALACIRLRIKINEYTT